MRHEQSALGTDFVVNVPDPTDETLAAGLSQQIDRLDQLFNVSVETSEISRIAAGQLSVDEASSEVREALTRCDQLRTATGQWFEFEPRQRTGNDSHAVLDPTPFVAGWVADQLATSIRIGGHTEYVINVGGHVLCGEAPEEAWQIGLRHPVNKEGLMAVLQLTSAAAATVGDGREVAPGGDPQLLSATVVGPELAEAGALAAAAFACGQPQPPWWGTDPRYELLIASTDGRLLWTQGMGQYLLKPAADA